MTKGIRTTNASTLLRNFVPEEDATVIARIKEGRRGVVGEAEHERVRFGWAVHVSLRSDAESVEYGLRAWVFQFRFRGCGGRCSLRHVLGRRHVRVDTASIVVVRCGGTSAHLGQGEPVWADADYMVHGPGGADVPFGGGLRHYAAAHLRLRPEGPEHG